MCFVRKVLDYTHLQYHLMDWKDNNFFNINIMRYVSVLKSLSRIRNCIGKINLTQSI